MNDKIPPFLKPVTVWERHNKQDNGTWLWEHNHIEYGHCPNEVPTPLHENHVRFWRGAKWRKEFKYLNENNVIV